jgi:hypothetical protein
VEAEQSVELTGPNRPFGLTINLLNTQRSAGLQSGTPSRAFDAALFSTQLKSRKLKVERCASGRLTFDFELSTFRLLLGFPATLPEGSHPFPYRTRKLSPPGPMVLRGQLRGRVGRRRDYFAQETAQRILAGPFLFAPLPDLKVFDSPTRRSLDSPWERRHGSYLHPGQRC